MNVLHFVATTLVVACGSANNIRLTGSAGTTGAATTGAGGMTAGNGAHSSSATGLDSVASGATTAASSGAGAGSAGTFVYMHDNTTLYSLDPMNPAAAPKTIGSFDCIGKQLPETSMTDFAVSSNGEMWAISSHVAHKLQVQNGTVHCATSTPLMGAMDAAFYALSFAPVGTIDPNKEVLVAGDSAGELFAIDENGNLTQHGVFGTVPADDGHGNMFPNAGTDWELSGDIVFLANNGKPIGFATVRDCPSPPSTSGCDQTDTLIEIDMGKLAQAGTQSVALAVRGQVIKSMGCNDATNDTYGSMFGIAAWNDKIYGFAHGPYMSNGFIVSISNSDGTACLIQPSSTKWDGAGVTTVAPVMPPPVK